MKRLATPVTSFVGEDTHADHPASDVVLNWAYDAADVFWQSTSTAQAAAHLQVSKLYKSSPHTGKLNLTESTCSWAYRDSVTKIISI